MTRKKIESLLSALGKGAFEREEVIALSLLSALAEESIFLLGLPGVAKSMIARRLSLAFRDARRFEYLMSRFSTPDEIFGPVSISRLKDSDTYERVTDGYLPTADVVFLDEIWKAGPAIQNSLLTALNEKLFHNGRNDVKIPLKGIIAASNELPAEGEGLEALWDRFLIRYVVSPIRDRGNFIALLSATEDFGCSVDPSLQLTGEDLAEIRMGRVGVEIPSHILDLIYTLRTRYSDTDDDSLPYISDRRWKKIAGILRTSAYLNGRESVDWSDCLLMEHMLWDRDAQVALIEEDIEKEIIDATVKRSAGDGDGANTVNGSEIYWSPDGGKHYAFEAGGDLMKIQAEDYDILSPRPMYGRFGEDNTIIVSHSPAEFSIRKEKPGTVTINNFTYPMKTNATIPANVKTYDNEVISRTSSALRSLSGQIEDNLFTRGFQSYKILGTAAKKYRNAPASGKKSR